MKELKGKGIVRKYKNRRVKVFICENGDVQIGTKRLRSSLREPVIVSSCITYSKQTFGEILGMWLELQADSNGRVFMGPLDVKSQTK